MKIGKLPLYVTTWMSRLDKIVCAGSCNTNPYFATFLIYVFLIMGVFRDFYSTAEVFDSLDDVYEFMLPQDEGLGMMCLIFCMAETIMLCRFVPDMVARFIIIVVLANVFYMIGLLVEILGWIMLVLIILAYFFTLVQMLVHFFHKLRTQP